MWPWEHLAFGYAIYSVGRRTLGRRTPGGAEAAAVVFGTQLPDLIDKPLSWGLEVFPTGYALGHSLVLALPLSAGVLALARRRDRPAVGVAFVVGYGSHLLGDVISPLRHGRGLGFERLLWPFVSFPGYATDRGLVGRTVYYLTRALAGLDDTATLLAVTAYLMPFVAVGLLWLADGAPGTRGALALARDELDLDAE